MTKKLIAKQVIETRKTLQHGKEQSKPARQRKNNISTTTASRAVHRVFIVDDRAGDIENLELCCNLTQEGDIHFVGGYSQNDPNLPDLIKQADANIVLVDLALAIGGRRQLDRLIEDKETSGVHAISAIRRALGSQVRLVAYSYYGDFRQRALDAGADVFLCKGAIHDEIRRVIRGGMPPTADIGQIEALELHLDEGDHWFAVRGTRGSTGKLRPDPLPFAFLYYLAVERKEGKAGFVMRRDREFRLTQTALWNEIRQKVGSDWGLRPAGTTPVSQLRRKVNAEVEPYLASKLDLIQGPRSRGGKTPYALNPTIAPGQILLPGD